MELKEFQKEGVRFLHSKNGNALIADEMGTGKTIQSIVWMNEFAKFPALIVCPASLKYNWEQELSVWGNPLHKVSIISKKWVMADIVIINYDILKKFEKDIMEAKFQVIICDESQYIKSQKSIRAKIVKKICQPIPHKIFLSGTPIQDRPRDIYQVLNILAPTMPWFYRNQCEKYWDFAKKYCNLHHKEIVIHGGRKVKVLDDSGASNKPQLSELLKSVMIRRLKSEVLTELPAKNKTIVPIEESDKEDEALFKQEMQRNEEDNIPYAAVIEKYRQYAVMRKLPQSIQFIKNIADNEKVIVGIHHREAGNELYKALKDYQPLAISGETSPEKRQQIVEEFQNNPERRIIICSIKAAGVGLTLTAACKVVILETMYTPSELEQFTDRAHRMGQTNNVDIYYLVIRKSIDSAMMRLLVSKQKTITSILDGKERNLFTQE